MSLKKERNVSRDDDTRCLHVVGKRDSEEKIQFPGIVFITTFHLML